ncbi:c-type cytochrome [Nitrococcus mobilis]|uniref:c-type cytochrome n=1 Tax=Nitrococcus mobilis TaxID=35797 RepID=UPI0003253A52|nr:cytochrome c [Nitrococcus mobilis]
MKIIKMIVLLSAIGVLGVAGFIYSGLYPIGADVPHNAVTYWVLETLRERSIKRAASDINVPDLSDPELLLSGGPDYNEMCLECHLKPGKNKSDMSVGLYPSPPNLSQDGDGNDHNHDEHGDEKYTAQRQFWIIKHGIKASGMPAWGETHDDQRIWAMVAFLQKLPRLTPEQYQIITARSDGENNHSH